MDYNLILQWYYYTQTGVWPTFGMNKETDKWCLNQSGSSMGYEYWQGTFPAPDLNNAEIFNAENETTAATVKNTLWQLSKNIILKMVENNYVEFLKYDWSPKLQSYGIIPPGYEITVGNTDSAINMYFLLVLKKIDEPSYERLSNEFLKYKTTIESAGGIMSEVIFHPEIEESSSSSVS